jgi:16S rRNA (cytidine1402-2'-O)-methyltransferase
MATLYVVGTPIGNLGDLSRRAAEVLCSVDRILAEDTRRTRILATRVGAQAPLVSLHEHNEAERTQGVLEWLAKEESLALVSDAGMPLISDPGARLVRAVLDAGHAVIPVPGPSAVLAALVASGLPAARFTFLGFLARKGPERAEDLQRLATSRETVVVFEAPGRLARLLDDLRDVCGPERRAAVARELTKVHEEVQRGTLDELTRYYREEAVRGEVTVVVAPEPEGPAEADGQLEAQAREMARAGLAGGKRPSELARDISRRLALPRNVAYRIVHEISGA